ncbi:hypothetical protein HaLaN_24496 [Haematococcus lacustris]|uniref:Uncharacterized protein n=1 Tax=Haematococcus lacustris TaxID=44745 RepID=A0A6A0A1G2_HAELA|nr:hypothetical protein HaLaN_24496 [Haematococcus lacustris]
MSVVYTVLSSQPPVFRLSIRSLRSSVTSGRPCDCLRRCTSNAVNPPGSSNARRRMQSAMQQATSLLLGLMWLMAFIYFNKRVLDVSRGSRLTATSGPAPDQLG